MGKRIYVMLPEATIRAIDRLARPGHRSRFIDRAVQHFVATTSEQALQKRLKAAATRDRDLALEMADEWKAVDQEQWNKLDQKQQRPARGRNGVKSTSSRSTCLFLRDGRLRNRF